VRLVRRYGIGLAVLVIAAAAIGLFMHPPTAMAEGAAAPAASGAEAAHDSISIPKIWWIAPIGSILALVFAWVFYKQVMAAGEGDPEMQEIAAHVREGAMAYLRQQYKVVTIFFIVVSALLALMAFGFHAQHWLVPFAFLTGGFFSGLCGYLGMRTATNASHRTCAGARESLNRGLVVAFRAGAVMGLVVVGFGLIDITGWFLLLSYLFPKLGVEPMSLETITVVMLCFGMGASSQALFARVGGGIFTKAADVGADLVGKVEAGIPEDDARNPATIADNVGDNVGDVAGMGADLYESYCGSILATAALGVAAASALSVENTGEMAMKLLSAPMVLAGIGIVLSIIGIYMVRTQEGATMRNLLRSLLTGVLGSSVLIAIVAAVLCTYLFADTPVRGWGVWGSIMAGLVAGLIIGQATEYYTSYEYGPTRGISSQSETGPATIIIGGIAEGMKSTWASLATIIVAILCAFGFAGGFGEFTLGLYGVGIAAVGMLSTLGITLATDAYGPIADNAGGNAEMTHQDPSVRQKTDALDSLGNTTAATGKGFAIGSAALTALALLAAYVEEVRVGVDRQAEAYVVSHAECKPGSFYAIGYGKYALALGKGVSAAFMEGRGDNAIQADVIVDGKKADEKVSVIPVSFEAIRHIQKHKAATGKVFTGPFGADLDAKTASGKKKLLPATLQQYMAFYDVTLMNPKVLCGMFSGVLLAFVFCAMTMKAVGRAAGSMMLECRRQFAKMREFLRGEGMDEAKISDPENWPMRCEVGGESYPQYGHCVAIATSGAQREMVIPSLLALVVPITVGLVFDVAGVMGLLAGGLTSGFAVAIFMANAGGAWDNAKKLIETFPPNTTAQQYMDSADARERFPELEPRAKAAIEAGTPDLVISGKGSEDHKAGVVGDTVGDPFKDTSGPSLNILIKLMSMVSVVFAGLIVKFAPQIGELLGITR